MRELIRSAGSDRLATTIGWFSVHALVERVVWSRSTRKDVPATLPEASASLVMTIPARGAGPEWTSMRPNCSPTVSVPIRQRKPASPSETR